MGRPAGSADIAPKIRGSLKRAMLMMEEAGKPLSTIWLELFADDPVNAMRLAISLLPKEIQADVNVNAIEDFVTGRATQQALSDSSKETLLQ